jgi:hypothetical protein
MLNSYDIFDGEECSGFGLLGKYTRQEKLT